MNKIKNRRLALRAYKIRVKQYPYNKPLIDRNNLAFVRKENDGNRCDCFGHWRNYWNTMPFYQLITIQKRMKVLSLFDGMSCGQIALKQLGIIPERYYASEVDKHAIKQTQLNFPDTIQLGDVTKWKEWDIDWKSIDLILAGSPCQGFSFAGKQLAFDDPRSKLFFVFIDILNHVKLVNSDVLFLLENVKMKRSHLRVISEYCGVFPVNIDSNLVSAQNRDRWYWTNIRTRQVGLFGEVYVDIPQPEDKGIFLPNIVEDEVDEKYFVNKKCFDYITKEFRLKKKYTQINSENKALPLMAKGYSNWTGDYICVAMRGREVSCLTPKRTEYGKSIRKDYEAGKINERRGNMQQLEPRSDGKTNCITSVQKDNLLITSDRIRRLTPIECSRLQTIPSWYRWDCSDTQIYKMLGNGWTVDVIVHILSFMKEKLNINVA